MYISPIRDYTFYERILQEFGFEEADDAQWDNPSDSEEDEE